MCPHEKEIGGEDGIPTFDGSKEEIERNMAKEELILEKGVEINTVSENESMEKGVERSKVKENEVVERNKPRKKSRRVRSVENKYLDLLSRFYRKNIYNGLNNVDVVSKEESEHRIELCGFVTGILLLIPATVLTSLLCIAVLRNPQPPMIIAPKLTNPPVHGFPEQHVALIYHDGSVYDISLNKNVNISPSKQLILKLPKDKTYFGFVNEQQGILNFISSNICRPITQFKLFKHNIIPNTKPKIIDPKHYHFSQGIQVGNMFWVWAEDTYQYQYHVLHTGPYSYPKTFIYYWKRNSWKEGPSFYFTSEVRRPFATTSINATAAMAVFDAYIDDYNVYDVITYVYDFELEKWSNYPNPIFDEHSLYQTDFSLTTLISKTARKVYLHASLLCFTELAPNKETVWLLSYDLKDGPNGVWIVEHKGPSCIPKESHGSIFSSHILT